MQQSAVSPESDCKDGLARIMAGIIELSRENLIREVIEAKNNYSSQVEGLDDSCENPGESFVEIKTTSPIPAILQLEILQVCEF